MARLKVDGIYGVKDGDITWRTDGVELADDFSRRRPLKNLAEPLSLSGVRRGEFAVFAAVLVLGRCIGRESYLITQLDGNGLALAMQSDAVQERPDELCSPYLRYMLGEVGPDESEAFGLTELGAFLTQPPPEPSPRIKVQKTIPHMH